MRKNFFLLLCCGICLSGFALEKQKIEPGRFINPEVCGDCHTDIYEQWHGSMHSKAFADPLWVKASKLFMAQAIKEGDKLEAQHCVKCHTPVGYLTEAIPTTEADFTKIDPISSQGVLCDFCHSIKEVHGVGNGAFVVEPGHGEDNPGTKRGPFKDSQSDYHQTAYSEIHTKAEFCGACHDVSHMANNIPIENTYSEWENSPYNSGDPATTVVCQDCHMRQKPGVPATGKTARPDNPGKAADDGPERPHIWTHYFVGANAALPELLGSKTHSEMAVERLQNAADLDIIPLKEYEAGSMERLKIRVKNTGAGHYLPTGLTMVRQMWLQISITDKNGQLIYESGKVDAKGKVDEEAIMFHSQMGDDAGRPVVNVAQADRILHDHRIPPKGFSDELVAFYIPKDAASPLKVAVKLNYRSAPQELANQLLEQDAPTLPIIEMVKAEKTIKLEDEHDKD